MPHGNRRIEDALQDAGAIELLKASVSLIIHHHAPAAGVDKEQERELAWAPTSPTLQPCAALRIELQQPVRPHIGEDHGAVGHGDITDVVERVDEPLADRAERWLQ